MGQAADKEVIQQLLTEVGIMPIGEATFDYLRIEAGLPRFGRELMLDYIPLEANLWADVSFTKGCYTGQEIIARMESRGRLAKRLVRLQAAGPVAAGTAITANGREVGRVTSAAAGPNGSVALGYVKTGTLETPERELELTADGVPLSLTDSGATS
jgi:aminomethyltransferase